MYRKLSLKTNQSGADNGKNIVLPLVLLGAIWIFDDYFFLHARLTPLLCLIALSSMAFIVRPRAMIFWGLIFSICVAYRLYNDAINSNWNPEDMTPHLRVAGFVVGATVTTLLCLYRVRLQRNATEVMTILSKLPVPVILSDASGTIIFANEHAASLLNCEIKEMVGFSYFTLLIHPKSQGRTISRYIEIIDSVSIDQVSIPLKVRGRDDLVVMGNLAHASFSGTKALITVLEVENALWAEKAPQ